MYAGGEPETETAFLLKICSVVERLIEEECRLIRLIRSDILAAAVANHYVTVVVANAGLRVHAAVHRLVDCRLPPPHTDRLATQSDWNSIVGRSDPAFDLRTLAELRKMAFAARLNEVAGVDDWRPTMAWVEGRLDRDEAAARKVIADEVDRIVRQHSETVRENVRRCDVTTLARFGIDVGLKRCFTFFKFLNRPNKHVLMLFIYFFINKKRWPAIPAMTVLGTLDLIPAKAEEIPVYRAYTQVV